MELVTVKAVPGEKELPGWDVVYDGKIHDFGIEIVRVIDFIDGLHNDIGSELDIELMTFKDQTHLKDVLFAGKPYVNKVRGIYWKTFSQIEPMHGIKMLSAPIFDLFDDKEFCKEFESKTRHIFKQVETNGGKHSYILALLAFISCEELSRTMTLPTDGKKISFNEKQSKTAFFLLHRYLAELELQRAGHNVAELVDTLSINSDSSAEDGPVTEEKIRKLIQWIKKDERMLSFANNLEVSLMHFQKNSERQGLVTPWSTPVTILEMGSLHKKFKDLIRKDHTPSYALRYFNKWEAPSLMSYK